MESLIIACLIGIFFGLSYNVLILIPLTLAAAITGGAAMAYGHTVSEALLMTFISALGLQGGYMLGLTSRGLLNPVLSRLHTAPSRRP